MGNSKSQTTAAKVQKYLHRITSSEKIQENEHEITSEDSTSSDMFSITEDVLILILSFVPTGDLLNSCCCVCRQWNSLISGHIIWKRKCQLERKIIPKFIFKSIPKNYYRNICLLNPYGRNMLRNNCGNVHSGNCRAVQDVDDCEMVSAEEDYRKRFELNVLLHRLLGRQQPGQSPSQTEVVGRTEYWTVESNDGDGWIVEDQPAGADPVPSDAGCQSCYATSYEQCMKYQIIDLVKEGVNVEVLDEVCPDIEVGEWHASRFDCGTIYNLKVALLNADHADVDVFEYGPFTEEQWAGSAWTKTEHVFTGYPPGVRFIYFEHSGKDTQYWAGHYGSKMTGGYVKFVWKG